MSSPELTYDEVVEVARPAVCTTLADPDDPAGHDVCREWRYEDGQVWLISRDEERTYSKRPAMPREIPWGGWHHDDGCDCPYCYVGRRRGSASTVQPEDDGRSGR